MNTMEDLRRVIAQRLRDTLHGREIDLIEQDPLRLEHMLGVIDVDEEYTLDCADGSLLDCDHTFWNEWHSDALSGRYVRDKVQTAIHSLKEDNTFRITYPYGEEAEIIYVEVDKLQQNPTETILQTSCQDCDTDISTVPNLLQDSGYYYLKFSIDCPECDFSGEYERKLQRI